jgi:CRP-like cAMP-binding protein
MVPQDLLQFIRTSGSKRSFQKGSIIIYQRDSVEDLYLIDSGYVSLYDIDLQHHARIAAIYPKNQIFPLSWLLKEPLGTGATFFYEAITDVVCVRISRANVHEFLKDNPEHYQELLDMMTKGFINSIGRIYNLQKSNVDERVNYILNFFASAYGRIDVDRIAEIDTAFTHKTIGDFAGLSREVVSRQLAKPKYKRILRREGSKVLIDLKLLNVDSMPDVYRVNGEKT